MVNVVLGISRSVTFLDFLSIYECVGVQSYICHLSCTRRSPPVKTGDERKSEREETVMAEHDFVDLHSFNFFFFNIPYPLNLFTSFTLFNHATTRHLSFLPPLTNPIDGPFPPRFSIGFPCWILFSVKSSQKIWEKTFLDYKKWNSSYPSHRNFPTLQWFDLL